MLVDERTVRRQISVDYEVPRDAKPVRWDGDAPVWYAPLFFLPKGADEPFDAGAPLETPAPHFANFDYRDRSGTSLSLPSRVFNGRVTSALLAAVVERAIEADDDLRPELERPVMREALRELALTIATSDLLSALQQLEALRAIDAAGGRQELPGIGRLEVTRAERLLARADAADPWLSTLLNACAVSSVVVRRVVGHERRSDIVKLGYDMQIADLRSRDKPARRFSAEVGWSGYPLWVETPYVGAGTFHFEIEAPDGLEFYDAGLVEIATSPTEGIVANFDGDAQRTDQTLDRASGYSGRLHLYDHSALRNTGALAWVKLRVRRHDFIGGAWLSSVLVAVALWAAYVLAGEASKAPASTSTLLLLFPSVLAAYVARPGPHPLTARMLRQARRLVGLSATLPFVAAALVALPDRDSNGHIVNPSFSGWWLSLALLATLIVIVLSFSRVLPLPEIERQRLAGLPLIRRLRALSGRLRVLAKRLRSR